MKTEAYACINKNDITRKLSSSGGIYPLIAEAIIRDGGRVFAACYDEELNVAHKMLCTIEDIELSQGSKYVESSLGDTFKWVLKHSSEGRTVLFAGTPCQCAGLNSLISLRNADRKNIFLMDFVCHGIPGRVPWDAFRKTVNNQGRILTGVNMRDKSSGWRNGDYSWKFTFQDGKTSVVSRRKVAYMKGMLSNLYLRPSCHECRFKGVDRCTDITVGDYWGVWGHLPDMDDNKGTSLVILHSEAGKAMFDRIKENIRFENAVLTEAVKDNPCIIESTKYNPQREIFFKRFHAGKDFTSLVEKLTNPSLMSRLSRKIRTINYKNSIKVKKENKDSNSERTIPVLYERKASCCGCTACYEVCPKDAITMKEDDEGFLYPVIDTNKCINCCNCLKVCPVKKRTFYRETGGCFE